MKKIVDNELRIYLQNLDFDEAISHRVHSRVFEILGYLSNVDKKNLSENDKIYLKRIENLSKILINEVHGIIEYYKSKKHDDTSSI
ncbi:MAG TPA: hypothetical protein VFF33_09895 [Ignavibacteriaceae bacterium]|nr:hypothetical protein [Ignavibacteriaceae bacterium]